MPKRTFDELVAQAAAAPNSVERLRIAALARKAVIPKKPKPKGRPSNFNEKIAEEVCSRISNGETLPKIVESLNIPIQNIYNWMDSNLNFLEAYRRSREQQAKTLVDKMLDETADLKNDQALAARVRSDVIKWVASRYAPSQFSDSKRIELKGEIQHKHTHELSVDQKRRIAESWLLSQQPDSLALEAPATGPDIEGVAVVCEPERELPKRKRAVQPKPKAIEPDESGKWRGH